MQRSTRLEWSILKAARDADPIHRQQLPVLAGASFLGFSRQFDAEIREAGAKTVLLMTWERPDSISAGVNTANLASAYNSVGTELGGLVAPAGLALPYSARKPLSFGINRYASAMNLDIGILPR